MRSIKMIGLAVFAVLAFSAVAASAAAAEEFEASEAGTLSGKALNTQKFKTGAPAEVECTTATPAGTVESGKLKVPSILISVDYLGCSVKGLGGSVTISLVDYTFFAPNPNPLVSILHLITIEAGALGVECTITVISGQSLGSGSGQLTYVQKGKNLELESKVSGIESEITKSNSSLLCGTVGEKSTTGTYTGNDEVELNGGSGTIKA